MRTPHRMAWIFGAVVFTFCLSPQATVSAEGVQPIDISAWMTPTEAVGMIGANAALGALASPASTALASSMAGLYAAPNNDTQSRSPMLNAFLTGLPADPGQLPADGQANATGLGMRYPTGVRGLGGVGGGGAHGSQAHQHTAAPGRRGGGGSGGGHGGKSGAHHPAAAGVKR